MENILLQKDNDELKQEIDDQNFYIDDLIKENQNLEDDNDKQKTKLIEYEEKISYLTSEHESNLNWIQNLQKKRNQQKKDFDKLCDYENDSNVEDSGPVETENGQKDEKTVRNYNLLKILNLKLYFLDYNNFSTG